jgi:hypothetical protein
MDTWHGHFPITYFVFQALLKKKAEAETATLSRAESVLFNACEFWAAVAKRELSPYLETRSVPRLLLAFEAFSEIGAVRVASALRMAMADCPEVPSSTWLRQKAFVLEAHLLDTEDAVDALIAQYASLHLPRQSTEGQEPVATQSSRSTGLGN